MENFERLFQDSGWNVSSIIYRPRYKSGIRRFLDYHRALLKAVRSKRADVVLACDLFSLPAARWMKIHGRTKRVIYDARELYTELPAVAKKKFVKAIWRTLEQRGMSHSDLILVTAPLDAEAILDVHGFLPRPLLVRNLPWLEPDLPRNRTLLDRFRIPNDAIAAVYLGGLQPARGLWILLETFRDLSDAHLLIIGDGPLRKALEEKAPSNVHFSGPMDSHLALTFAAACDIGIVLTEPVSKSYELALPSKVFEYMMCGLPVVSSPMQQIADLFPDEEWLIFVENDPFIVREGILKAHAKTQDVELLANERARAIAEFHFACDAKPLIHLLDHLLAM